MGVGMEEIKLSAWVLIKTNGHIAENTTDGFMTF